MKLYAVELYRYNVRLERHQVVDAAHFRVGFPIRPCRETRLANVVVTTQPFVRAEGSMIHRGERRFINVRVRNVPAWSKTGLIERQRSAGIGDDAVAMPNHEMS